MKKRIIPLLLAFVFVLLCMGCLTTPKEEQVLYMFSKVEADKSVKRSDGDCTIGVMCQFDVKWNNAGCILNYENYGKEEQTRLTVGQTEEIECYVQPITLKYEFFLANEGDELPDSWKEYFAETEKKQQKKKEIGTFEEYTKWRDSERKLSLIRDAFEQLELNPNADDWYQLFLEETWNHADVSIEITKAEAEELGDTMISLTLTDSDGNEMILYGFESGYIDYIKYKGEEYAGPYTG